MTLLSNRMRQIDASGIRKVFALAAKLTNPINLSIGQPDYDVDLLVKEAAINAIQGGQNGYTQTWGIEPLREAVGEYYEKKFGANLENIMITSGVSGGLFLTLMATINEGDEVLFADPYFVMYPHLVRLLGGVPVPLDTYPHFKLTASMVEAAITRKTKMVIINSPSNPTGVTLSDSEVQELAAVAKKHDLLVLSDEIYESLQYDEAPSSITKYYDKVVLLNGLSKSAAMTGWRVGFSAGPEEIIQAMNTLQQYTFVCAPSFAQHAALVALEQDLTDKVDAYRIKRDLIYEGLRQYFNVTKPGGAFYIFPEAPNQDGDAFVKEAIENNLLIIPGSVFSSRKSHLRVSFAATDETIRSGLEVMKRLAGV